ncbi:MAG: histidine phosphatase family protein [Alphaproteobacteria bacterium]|nr:histidine phosphatase family protein [Alphaproteobacteria bacterium]MDE2111344.1 histidine phosphatase family protein [Alphaproteobacteria bacterium]MDE2495603.1 histidine phosphatase family protein [Alphaproteobacteria bacterium]
MKRLFLLRHAKASREEPGLNDRDRPLAERGRNDAARIGRLLHEEIYIPDTILCSTSVRTRETLELILPELSARPIVQYRSELYLAAAETILAAVRGARHEAGALMIVGHNPGLEDCARELVREPTGRRIRKRYATMTEKFPTCALAVIDFDVEHWSGVAANGGELEFFVRPKDLRDTQA